MPKKLGTDLSLLTKDFLFQAYCVEKRTILSIARQVGCRNGVVVEALSQHGLGKRPTKEWMIEHYLERQESVDNIAVLLGCTESNVRYYLRNFGIPIRYKPRGRIQISILNDRDWLYDKYITQQLSTVEIADEIGCAVSSVLNALKRFDIPLRESGMPSKGKPSRKPYTARFSFSHRKRRLIHKRDNHQCCWCGSSGNLDIHHIIPRRAGGTNDLNNGITLCETCHFKTYGKEEELVPFFQNLLANPGAAHLVVTPLQLRLFGLD